MTQTQVSTVAETIKNIETHGKTVANNAPKTFTDFPVGQASAQGDVYIIRIKNMPKSAKPRNVPSGQVADGNSPGARHCLVKNDAYNAEAREMIKLISEATGGKVTITRESCIGPVFNGTDTLTHPEHGHQTFPEGVYAVVFQRSLDSEQREERVRD